VSAFLGIDHPLILFRDLERGVEQFRRLGFNTAPIGYHPWGTSMSFVTFPGCAFELMSIYDASLTDKYPAGDFKFGRYIAERLAEREGLSLVALFSTDAEGDTKVVTGRGIQCQGAIEYGRAVRLPDGHEDRTATTLKILFDPTLKRASHFICQQHRPDLVWTNKWMTHPNGATGLQSMTYFAPQREQLRTRFAGLYGAPALSPLDGGFAVQTGNAVFEVLDQQAITARFGALPGEVGATEPAGVAVAVHVADLARTAGVLRENGVLFAVRDGRITLRECVANVWIEFLAKPHEQR
jgi:hypothetical protein